MIAVALLLIGCAGAGATALLLPKRDVDWPEFLGLAVIFGGAFVSLALFIGGFFLREQVLHAAVALSCVALGASGGMRMRKMRACPMDRSFLIAAPIVLAQTAIVAWQAMNQTLRWDGLFTWEIKARIAFANAGRIPLAYFADPSRVWSHPHYPLAVPLTEAWLYRWLGAPDSTLVKLLFPFVYLAAAALLFSAGERFTGDARRGAIAAVLFFFVPCLIVGPGSAPSGWADFPLATVYLAAMIYLLDYVTNSTRDALRMLSICAAILPWIKQEGVILAGCVFLIALVVAWTRRETRLVLLAALPAVLVVAGWKAFLLFASAPPQHDFLHFTPTTLFANWRRLAEVAQFIAGEAVNFSRWSALWLLALAALLELFRHRPAATRALASGIFLPIAIYGSIYVFSAWPDFRSHLSTSLPRLMSDVSLVAVLAIALALPLPARGEKIARA